MHCDELELNATAFTFDSEFKGYSLNLWVSQQLQNAFTIKSKKV